MSNQPSKDNVLRSARIPRELDMKVRKTWLRKGMKMADAYIIALTYATSYVELTAEDHELIAKEMREVSRKGGK